MAVVTVAITGHVLAPDGSAPTSGRLVVKLSQAGSTLDGSESVRVATEITEDLAAGGAVSFALVPNDVITPAGTYYLATFVAQLASGRRVQWAEKWQLTSADLTLDIGAVPRTDIIAGVALQQDTAWPEAAAASVAAAAASELAAAESQAVAEAALAGAQAARDAAASAALVYVDVAAGLAATASGGYFWVPAGSGQPDVLILYLDNAGVAVEQGRMTSSERVGELDSVVHPMTSDTGSALFYFCDVNGKVIGYFDSAARLWLSGRQEALQTKLLELDNLKTQAGSGTDLYQWVDRDGRVVARLDSSAGLLLCGLTSSVQAIAEPAKRDVLWDDQGVVIGPSFTPMAATYPASERFIWAGARPGLRPNQTRFTAYPFDWTTDPVAYTAVRRARSILTAPDVHNWTLESITVSGIPSGEQFRDISWLYDRALGKYWYVVNGISSQGTGFLASDFPVYDSTDGLVIAHVYNVGLIPGSPTRVWSPEWFIDDDGTVYVVVSADTEGAGFFAYHLLQCTDTSTMATWSYVAKLTGTAFPTEGGGSINVIDPFMFKRGGVYYVVWKAETAAGGSHTVGQLGIAWSTTLAGPYNYGSSFIDPGPTNIRGEGPCVVELPVGSDYRFRLFFDNYLSVSYGGSSTGVSYYADTNDFQTWTVPKITNLNATVYNRHFTALIGD